jgi:hypothetical protein
VVYLRFSLQLSRSDSESKFALPVCVLALTPTTFDLRLVGGTSLGQAGSGCARDVPGVLDLLRGGDGCLVELEGLSTDRGLWGGDRIGDERQRRISRKGCVAHLLFSLRVVVLVRERAEDLHAEGLLTSAFC